MDALWPPGAATGIGSLPGTDIAEALRMVLGELPDLPHLPELPARGAGGGLIGRGAALMVDLPVELYAGRWKIADRPGRDLRRARDVLERDLDALHEQASGYAGALKVQAAGPWTLAAAIELPLGGRLLRDAGAVRDLTASLAEGLRAYVADVAARTPQARLLLQLDEPSLPAVLAGRVPTDSGLYMLPAVDAAVARTALADVIAAVGVPVVVHCCAPEVPVTLLREAGAAAISIDIDLVEELDPLGEAIDAGVGLVAGAADPRQPGAADPRQPGAADRRQPAPTSAVIADRVRALWRKLGFPPAQAARRVAVSPACGLADATPADVRALLAACRDAGRRILDDE